jgi:hypothetical protein
MGARALERDTGQVKQRLRILLHSEDSIRRDFTGDPPWAK